MTGQTDRQTDLVFLLVKMETIFYGVVRVKLSFHNGNNLLWDFAC